ncbi:MAG: hypothetical protein DRI65_03785 [Chloroflexota bacterium]|nr:MAG: hypothetical protein DRI65_03785 [Chloroflexota bacterium]HDD62357.1 DUF2085 domain-containing protein [Chloroflexota bacterium]
MLTVTLYMRQNCPLCMKAEEDLKDLQGQIPHRLVLIDIEQEGISEFVDKIPVIEIGPYQIKAPFDKKDIQMTLGAANDRIQQLDNIQTDAHQKRIKRGSEISFGDRLFQWLSRRYMVIFNAFTLLYVGLAFLAPVLMNGGRIGSANLIYSVYGRLCHQLSFRSWFLYGEQGAYPREIAKLPNLVTYEDATGNDPFNLEKAIRFRGNEELGFKVAFCQRDIAIYSAILLFGIIFSLTGRKIPSLPLAAWFLLGILPIGLDGLSQIVSQLPWDIIPVRESTPLLRTITGGLFGFTTAWFGYPIVEESMADSRKVMAVKFKAAQIKDQSE